jgi:hypothetical protein
MSRVCESHLHHCSPLPLGLLRCTDHSSSCGASMHHLMYSASRPLCWYNVVLEKSEGITHCVSRSFFGGFSQYPQGLHRFMCFISSALCVILVVFTSVCSLESHAHCTLYNSWSIYSIFCCWQKCCRRLVGTVTRSWFHKGITHCTSQSLVEVDTRQQ